MNEDELVEQYESNMRLAEEIKHTEKTEGVELTELEENVELYKDTDVERQYLENEIKNSHERLDDHFHQWNEDREFEKADLTVNLSELKEDGKISVEEHNKQLKEGLEDIDNKFDPDWSQIQNDRIDAEDKLAEVKTELRSFDEEVKLAVAKDEDTSAQTLDFLSEDRSEEVREAVINNPNASEETLENMDRAAMLENDFQALNVNDQVDIATDGQFNNDKQTESGSMRM